MSDEPKRLERRTPEAAEATEHDGAARTITVAGGRTVAVSDAAVELRSPGGVLELRIKLTEEGPVLQVEGVKVAIHAADAVSVDARRFEVRAAEGMTLHSDGELDLTSEKELRVKSTDDVVVRGKIIHLN